MTNPVRTFLTAFVPACALAAVAATGCAKTVTVPPSSYSELDGTVVEHGLRIRTTDGDTYHVARARSVRDSIEVLEFMPLYDERNTGRKPDVPFAISRDGIASLEEVHMRSKTSLAIMLGVGAALLAGFGWIFSQSGGGR
jgi:hypothetical protein